MNATATVDLLTCEELMVLEEVEDADRTLDIVYKRVCQQCWASKGRSCEGCEQCAMLQK